MTITANPSILEWRGGAFQYCSDLIENGGDGLFFPRNIVRAYINTQIIYATEDGRTDVADALQLLKNEWLEVSQLARCL